MEAFIGRADLTATLTGDLCCNDSLFNPTPHRDSQMDHVPSIGLDLDGCIDEALHFFAPLSHTWPGDVYVITYRSDYDKARQYVDSFGIRYTDLILVNRFEDKAVVIKEKGIQIYFDDQDEMLMHIPENVTVLKVRNGGNYDSDSKQWLYSAVTGRLI